MASTRMPVRGLLRALLEHDEPKARQVVETALSTSGLRVAVFADLVQPVVSALDDLWYRGQVDVAEEQWSVAVLAAAAGELPPTISPAPVPPGSRLVLAGLGGEEHGIGMELVALALEDEGWEVTRLGSRTPPSMLLEAVAARRPNVVGLSASYLPQPKVLAETVAALSARRMKVLVGGQAFARVGDLWRWVGADGYGVDARAGVVMARGLLGRSGGGTLSVSPARRERQAVGARQRA